MARWKAYRSSHGEVFEKAFRYKDAEDGTPHRLKITIDTREDDGKLSVISFKLEKNFLDYMTIPGGHYYSHITEDLGGISRPMKKYEVKAFFRIIYQELSDLKRASTRHADIKGGRKEHLANALDNLTDEIGLYDGIATGRIGPDWRNYKSVMKSFDPDEIKTHKKWVDGMIKTRLPNYYQGI